MLQNPDKNRDVSRHPCFPCIAIGLLLLFSRSLSPLHTLCQQILDLSIHRTELLFCPLCDLIVKLLGKSQWNLFFHFAFFFLFLFQNLSHLLTLFTAALPDDPNTDFRCSRSAVHLYFRREQPEDCSPLLLFVLHLILQYHSHSICQVPSLPYRLHLPRSSVSRQ